jgi:threonine dehydratase
VSGGTRTLVALEEIHAAARRIALLARRTPILELGTSAPSRVLLKCENMQPSGAFKIRGAANMLQQLTPDQRRRGVITYSSGNHGQAVALAARHFSAPAVIVMPTTAPQIKVDGVRSYGAEVIFEGMTSADRRVRAEHEATTRGLTMVPPFDHEWIIAGQGTAGLEILEQVIEAGLVLVPIGGGGLASGVAAAIKLSRPDVTVVGVEPEGANAMQQSLAAGAPISIASSASIADGLLPVRPGELTFAHVRTFIDEVVTVSEKAIVAALRSLYYDARLVVEPSGAVALAAILSGAASPYMQPSRPVVAVVSGGNVSPESLVTLLDAPSTAEAR